MAMVSPPLRPNTPLLEVSPNLILDKESPRKRSHEEFSENLGGKPKKDGDALASTRNQSRADKDLHPEAVHRLSAETILDNHEAEAESSRHDALTGNENEPMGRSPAKLSSSPQHTPVKRPDASPTTATTPTSQEQQQQQQQQQQKLKRQKLTTEEKEARAKETEEKKRIAVEKAEERRRFQEERKRKREDEEKRIRDEKEKKERSQLRLVDFFKKASASKKEQQQQEQAEPVTTTAEASTAAEYDSAASKMLADYKKRFRPFHLKPDTRLARSPFAVDDEGAKADKGKRLDEYVKGKCGSDAEEAKGASSSTFPSLDPVAAFGFVGRQKPRGKRLVPVRSVVEQLAESGGTSSHEPSGNALKKSLEGIPLKYLHFYQDVRPPYIGTVTFQHPGMQGSNMAKVARRPTARRLPLQYDYDSEAEWQDEEEGEDVDMDEDEDEPDEDDDMGDFVDDSEDSGLSRRVFLSDMEPVSTGVCFEDERHQASQRSLDEYRMEFLFDELEHTWGFDPLSPSYWETPSPTGGGKKKAGANVGTVAGGMPPPTAPVNGSQALLISSSTVDGGGGTSQVPEKLPKPDVLQGVRETILANRELTKTGVQDVIFARYKNDGMSRAEVKTAFEWLAEKQGQGKTKFWAIREGR